MKLPVNVTYTQQSVENVDVKLGLVAGFDENNMWKMVFCVH